MRVSDGAGHQPVRAVVGAAIGLSVWLVLWLQLIPLPGAVAFYIGAVALIFGCGALPLLAVAPEIPTAERTALACALGLTLSPALLLVFSVARCGFLFPPLAFAATGAAAALWRRVPSPPSRDARWYIVLPAVVFALTAWVSAGRMTVTDSGLSIYGNYDTLDLTYYAAISTAAGSHDRHSTGVSVLRRPPDHLLILSPGAAVGDPQGQRRPDAPGVSLVRLAALHECRRRDGLRLVPPAGFRTVCRHRIPARLHRFGPLLPGRMVVPEHGGRGSADLGERLHGAVGRVAVLQPVGADAQRGQPGPLWGESPR